jgi:outer membrane protein TolC
MEAARERLDLSQLEVTQARDRFIAGVAGNLDVIQASSNLNTARSQLVEALAQYQNSRVTLARAEGTITRLP